MTPQERDDPSRAFHFLVADALEALIPLVDDWAHVAQSRIHGDRPLGYMDGYRAGTQAMAAEVKDQLIERVLHLRG